MEGHITKDFLSAFPWEKYNDRFLRVIEAKKTTASSDPQDNEDNGVNEYSEDNKDNKDTGSGAEKLK